MIEMKLSSVEKRLGKRLHDDTSCVGLDTASRSGWCKIVTDRKNDKIYLDYGYIKVDTKDMYFKLDELIKIFQQLISTWNCKIVIEDVFFGRNVNTLKVLTRIGTICYTLARLKAHHTEFIMAVSARAKLGLKTNVKKEVVHKQFTELLKIDIKDIDIIDAIVLALGGLLQPEGLM
jgi:Holliday junction resolvasome RuvABC endonuclease subunit